MRSRPVFDGFDTQTKSGITLTVGAELPIDFAMSVGKVTENVQVSVAAASVDTVSATLRHNVSGTTIRELPLNGRDWTQLALLQPGVVGVGSNGGTRSGNGMKMAVAGARPSENNYRLNGIGVNDYANTTPGNALGTNLGVEAVAEFSVLTNSYSAEYGPHVRRRRQRHHPLRHEPDPRHRLRVPPQQRDGRARLLRSRRASRRPSIATSTASPSAARSSRTGRSGSATTKACARSSARRRSRPPCRRPPARAGWRPGR